MLRLIAISLVICVVSVYGDDEEKGAIAYTDELFNEKISTLPHFVKFYAPWCGHCKRMAPVWEELGKKFNVDEDQEVVIAKVDCTVETKLCSAQGVKGYPTVKWFSGSDAEGEKYSGPRDINELTSFIKVTLVGGKDGGAEGEGEKAADKTEEVADPATKVEGVWTLTGNSFKNHIAQGHHFIKFFAPWCGHCKSMAATWIEMGKDLEKNEDAKATINEVDCTAHKEVCSEQGVRGYPTIMWFTDGKMIEKYGGARDKKSLSDYITKMVEGKPEANNQAEKVPEKKQEAEKPAEETSVTVLTGDNFDATIAEGTTFVKFYAPWCGHCKKLVPTWEELAAKHKGNDKVTIAKMDCTVHKDACSKHGVKGYPTLILFRDGKNEGKHSGARTLDGLDAYVTSKLGHDEL